MLPKRWNSLIQGMGGTVEADYWAYGADDFVSIIDFPDGAAAVACSLALSRSGAVQLTTTPLLTAEDMEAAAQRLPDYRAPGA